MTTGRINQVARQTVPGSKEESSRWTDRPRPSKTQLDKIPTQTSRPGSAKQPTNFKQSDGLRIPVRKSRCAENGDHIGARREGGRVWPSMGALHTRSPSTLVLADLAGYWTFTGCWMTLSHS